MIIDSHCHVSPIWYEPVEVLLHQMDRNGVAQAVLIQMLGQFDNSYQQNCLQHHAGRFASVIAVDPARSDALVQLRRLADDGASGLRLRPTARSSSDDPLAIWRAAESLGLPISCVGNTASFSTAEFARLIESVPNLVLVLEHLGGTSTPDATEEALTARRQVFELARYPNVYLKLPGLGELVPRSPQLPAEGCPFEPSPAIVHQALECFGAARLMWGSDFPPVATREGYANALRWCREALADAPRQAQAAIFGGNAQRIFKLPTA